MKNSDHLEHSLVSASNICKSEADSKQESETAARAALETMVLAISNGRSFREVCREYTGMICNTPIAAVLALRAPEAAAEAALADRLPSSVTSYEPARAEVSFTLACMALHQLRTNPRRALACAERVQNPARAEALARMATEVVADPPLEPPALRAWASVVAQLASTAPLIDTAQRLTRASLRKHGAVLARMRDPALREVLETAAAAEMHSIAGAVLAGADAAEVLARWQSLAPLPAAGLAVSTADLLLRLFRIVYDS